MRPRNRWIRLAFAGGVIVLFAAALLPLSLLVNRSGLPASGLAAREVEGTFWSGSLRSASWRGLPLGDVSVRLRLMPLLLGRQWFHLSTAEGAEAAVVRGTRCGVADVSGQWTVPGPAMLSASEVTVRLRQVTLVFDRQRCLRAGGRVELRLNPGLAALPELELEGDAACAGADGQVLLSSAADAAPNEVDSILTIDARGGYRLQTTVRSADPAIDAALQASGFVSSPVGLVLVSEGRLPPVR